MEVVLLYIFSFLTRFLFLVNGQPSITNDEADYYLSSYMLAKTGSDLYGKTFFLTSGMFGLATSAIPIYMGALFYVFSDMNIFMSRLPFALFNSLGPVFLYLVVRKITKNKPLAYFSFMVMNFSPWFMYLSSQAAFDAPVSLTFFLISFYVYINGKLNLKRMVGFLILSFLTFNSYMGIKTVFPFLLFIILSSRNFIDGKRIDLISLAKNSLLAGVMFIIFFALSYVAPGSQLFKERGLKEIVFFNAPLLENKVWYDRLLTQGQSPLLQKIFFNKVTEAVPLFLNKYFAAFDLKYLFLTGDPHPIYGTNNFGLFYFFEIIPLLLGVYFLIKKLFERKWSYLTFPLLFLFAPIPAAISINDATIALRDIVLIIPYCLTIALGYAEILKKVSTKKLLLTVTVLYVMAGLYFNFIFNFKFIYASSQQWHWDEKLAFEKVKAMEGQYEKITIVNGEDREAFMLYSFYWIKEASVIKKKYLNRDFTDGKITITKKCPMAPLNPKELYVIKTINCVPAIYKYFTRDEVKPFIESPSKDGFTYYYIEHNPNPEKNE